jgi:hypothetical protein
VATEHVGKIRCLADLPKVFKGTHVQLPTVRVFRAAEVEISADRPFTVYADGDPIGELPVRVRAVRDAVRVLLPTSAAAGSAFGRPSPVPGPSSAPGPARSSPTGDEAPASDRRSAR